ncbi:potassium channel family protein [Candidatus Micrarchaeota archaeon]|nr:potassium channel family protein [Candidatus Micrarchaeota archaeon]
MPKDKSAIAIPILVLGILYVISILFFHHTEGWSYLDAAYFTTSTISTVGYGDIVPLTDYGKIGSMVLTFSGVGLAFYIITHLSSLRAKSVDPHVKKKLEMLRSFTLQSTGMKSKDVTKLKKKLLARDRK